MKIVHVSAEMAPLIKVGGLGDVVGGLSSALAKEGHDVTVILPFYKTIQTSYLSDLQVLTPSLKVYEKGYWQVCTVYKGFLNKVKVLLIKPQNDYFQRKKVYGYKDNVRRFSYFCSAVMQHLLEEKESIEALHIHDWHTALCALLYRNQFSTLDIKKITLTIHNLSFQGRYPSIVLSGVGLSPLSYSYEKHINLLELGFISSANIVAVSPTYSKEILTKKYGCSLDPTLRKYKTKLHGILNGIDQTTWDPKTDSHLVANYSNQDSLKHILEQKEKNKKTLQEKLHLKASNAPLVASIGRLTAQKGPKLIQYAIEKVLEKNGQFILLGSPGSPKIKKQFFHLQKYYAHNNNVHFHFTYDEELSHLVYSGADFMFIPSKFEPCGLTQILSFRYGTIPIVRKTGGLSDTVFDIDDPTNKNSSGYVFSPFSPQGVDSALNRALKDYGSPKQFDLIKKVMDLDYSWNKSCQKYLELY